jgi:AcrR family transcriptional regulator
MRDTGSPSACEPRCGGLRADAVRNRRRILTAARELLAEQGRDVSLDRIARLAGVSNATLYRHYGGRQELLTDVGEEIADAAAGAEAQLSTQLPMSDPLAALRGFLETLAGERPAALYCLPGGSYGSHGSEGFADGTAEPGPLARVLASTQRLLARAQRAGQVRDDVTAEEVLTVVAQLGRPLPGATWRSTDRTSPRLIRQYVDGLVVNRGP